MFEWITDILLKINLGVVIVRILTLLFILSVVIISGCTENIGITGIKNTNKLLNVNSFIPPVITFNVKPRTFQSPYYTNISNNPYYMAFVVTGQSSTKITKIELTNNTSNTYEVMQNSTPDIYKIAQCTVDMKIAPNQECEIIIHIKNSSNISPLPAFIKVSAGGMTVARSIKKASYALIAGDFTQVYPNGSIPGISQTAGSGKCGPNADHPCLILEYDFLNKTLTKVATTNNAINDITKDSNENLYISGIFNSINANGVIIGEPTDFGSTSLIAKAIFYDHGFSSVTDFIGDVTHDSNLRPDGGVYAMEYNQADNKLYIAGTFQKIGRYSTTNGFPLISYDLTQNNGNFNNALGGDDQNPNSIITALTFYNNFMYVSGYYGTISNFEFVPDYAQNTRIINKCSQNLDSYHCLSGSDYSLFITANQNYVQPTYSLTFDSLGGLYAGGGFSSMYYQGTSITDQLLGSKTGGLLVAYNSNPTTSFVNNPSNNWINRLNSSVAPDNNIGIILPYDNNKYYIGGQFSSIANIASDSNYGECGANEDKSCLVAQFDGTNWNKMFTTDGLINVIIPVDGITSN